MATNNDGAGADDDFDFAGILAMGDVAPEGDTPETIEAAPAEETVEEEVEVEDDLPPPPSTNDRLAVALEKLAAAQAAPAAPVAPMTPAEKKEFQFMLTQQSVPADLLAKLTSEDRAEQVQGMLALVSGVANMVRQRVRTEITDEYQPEFRKLVQDHVTQQAKQAEMIQDFRTSFPSIANHPESQVIGRLLSERAIKAMQAAGRPEAEMAYGPAFKKYLAAELKKISIKKEGAPAPAPKGAKPGGQLSRNGAPRAAEVGGGSLSDDIWNVVN
jgi:hypothetical protein